MTDAAEKKKRGRPKGTPKTGGRQKATRNRNSTKFLQALDDAGIHLLEFLIMDIAMLDPPQRVAEYKSLLTFGYPRLKAVEHVHLDRPTGAPPAASSPDSVPPPKPASSSPASRLDKIRGNKPTPKAQSGEPG